MAVKDCDKDKRIKEIAGRLIMLARDTIIVNMRFLDVALNRLTPLEKEFLLGMATDGSHLFYDSGYILRAYDREENLVPRMYLHSLLHCIFNHPFNYDKLDSDAWDMACDLAVENMIVEMDIPSLRLECDNEMKQVFKNVGKNIRALTAEAIYRDLLVNPLSNVDRLKYEELFAMDRHIYWHAREEYEVSTNDWKRLSERIKTELKAFTKKGNKSESLIRNLEEATKDKPNYKRLLEQFASMSEEICVNEDEFDYIYYTYGLNLYGNMPLIEPLEYKDSKKIKDFAIVLDTSSSCQGALIRKFLTYTYEILKQTENFFSHINVHIIQSDNEVHSDTVITCDADFAEFIKKGKIVGYGGTDFRPAIEYVNSLIEKQEFDDFKGMIYFTDGYGIYPPVKPQYECMFVFMDEDDKRMQVPWWAIPVVISKEDINEYSAGERLYKTDSENISKEG